MKTPALFCKQKPALKKGHIATLVTKGGTKMKSKYIYLSLLILIFIIGVKGVEGVACSGAPVENCTIGTGVTYQMPYAQTYNLNDSDGGGVIIITGANSVLDCNNSIIYGNFTTNTKFVDIEYNNVTIKNCIINGGYHQGIYLGWNVKNDKLINITTNGRFLNSAIYLEAPYNLTINNSNINGNTTSIKAIDGYGVKDLFINNNVINGFRSGISLSTGSNILINNNTINNTDQAIYLGYSGLTNNVLVQNNNISNVNSCYDGYALAIQLYFYCNNITVANNNIGYGSQGINIQNATNIFINNNTFYQDSIAYKLLTNRTCDAYGQTSAIRTSPLFKSFIGDGSENMVTDNITRINQYKNYNISISNNTFDNNVQTYLIDEGTIGLTQDLSNYWYRNIDFLPYLKNSTKMWNNNIFSTLSSVPQNGTGQVYYFYDGYNCMTKPYNDYCRLNITMSKTNITIININHSAAKYALIYPLPNNLTNVTIFNGTSFYPFNDVKNVSNGVILASNVNNYSILLSPNQQISIGRYTNTSYKWYLKDSSENYYLYIDSVGKAYYDYSEICTIKNGLCTSSYTETDPIWTTDKSSYATITALNSVNTTAVNALPKAGGVMSGNINMNGNSVVNIGNISGLSAGIGVTTNISMNTNCITFSTGGSICG